MGETKKQRSPLTTLCYIEKDDSYLMLHRIKKKQDVNEGKWIGVGGHFEENESPENCLLREVKEETGLTLTSWRFRGIVTFIAKGWPSAARSISTREGIPTFRIAYPSISFICFPVTRRLISIPPLRLRKRMQDCLYS